MSLKHFHFSSSIVVKNALCLVNLLFKYFAVATLGLKLKTFAMNGKPLFIETIETMLIVVNCSCYKICIRKKNMFDDLCIK